MLWRPKLQVWLRIRSCKGHDSRRAILLQDNLLINDQLLKSYILPRLLKFSLYVFSGLYKLSSQHVVFSVRWLWFWKLCVTWVSLFSSTSRQTATSRGWKHGIDVYLSFLHTKVSLFKQRGFFLPVSKQANIDNAIVLMLIFNASNPGAISISSGIFFLS